MLRSIQNNFPNVVLATKSFAESEPAILICLIVPIFLIVALHIRFINGERKAMKERETSCGSSSRKKNKKKKFKSCYDSASILGRETDITTHSSPKQRGPKRLTIAEELGFKAHETNPAQYKSEPGPKNRLTLAEALGPLGDDKKDRKWMVSVWRAVARFTCGNPTAAGEGRSKPLVFLMKEMDRAEERRKRKRGRREKREKGKNEGSGTCHACSQRSKNATLVPCGHAYCRVCSREIWINTRCCPICRTQIVEVLDTF